MGVWILLPEADAGILRRRSFSAGGVGSVVLRQVIQNRKKMSRLSNYELMEHMKTYSFQMEQYIRWTLV